MRDFNNGNNMELLKNSNDTLFDHLRTPLLWCLVILCGFGILYGARDDIKRKEHDLKKLRDEIDQYEQRIRESEQKEKVTLDRIDNYERQSNLLKSLLSKLTEEELQLRSSVVMTTENISFLEGQLSFLKMHYAKYISSVYKYGRVYDLETILSSKSINQLYIRIAYLKKFADQRRKDLQRITERKELLERERLVLQVSLLKERHIIAEKKTEQIVLKGRTEQRRQALHEIRTDKTTFQKELIRKTKAAEQLANLITDLIEKERIRKEHDAKLARERAAEREKMRIKIEEPPAFEPGVPFARKEGKLPWPVTSGVVVAQFGNQVHPVLKTVTQNTGIEISVPSGTSVKAVADAEVAMIHWLPSYGNLIILNHNDGYRTVYAHLSDIEVTEGQQVKEGTVIARSGDSVSGSVLHFELWKEKDKQNPEAWLARRR